jgi:hypothetical protein
VKRKLKKRAVQKVLAKKRRAQPKSVPVKWADDAIVGEVQDFGGDDKSAFNGVVVVVGEYHPMTHFFTTYPKPGPRCDNPMLYLRPSEIKPLTPAARKHVFEQVTSPSPVYEDEVYDLRDDLAKIEIFVKAASVNDWTEEQRQRISVYARLVASGDTLAPKPKELGR